MQVWMVWRKLRPSTLSGHRRTAETPPNSMRGMHASRRIHSTEDLFTKRVGYARRLAQLRNE